MALAEEEVVVVEVPEVSDILEEVPVQPALTNTAVVQVVPRGEVKVPQGAQVVGVPEVSNLEVVVLAVFAIPVEFQVHLVDVKALELVKESSVPELEKEKVLALEPAKESSVPELERENVLALGPPKENNVPELEKENDVEMTLEKAVKT